jgi:16S rRNA (uracil1498-N3)-methyltransferase
VVHLDQDSATAKLGKWQQLVLEACKQCGQNTLPNLHVPSAPAAFFQQTQSLRSLKLIASLQPEARPIAQVLKSTREERPVDDVLVVIGPEGDFTPSEIGSARAHGFLPVSLGPLILRSETASIFTASVLAYELQKGSS